SAEPASSPEISTPSCGAGSLARFSRRTGALLSTSIARAAPRETASRPTAPLPAYRSRTFAPGIRFWRMLKSASRARSEVGRAPSGTTRRRPFQRPAMIRTEGRFFTRVSFGRRELEAQLLDLLELAERLVDAFELDDSLLREELLDAEESAVEPLEQRAGRQVLRREPGSRREGGEHREAKALQGRADRGGFGRQRREVVEADLLSRSARARDREDRLRREFPGQPGAEGFLQVPDLPPTEVVAVERHLVGLELLALDLVVAAVRGLPDQRAVGKEGQPLVALAGLPDPLRAVGRRRVGRRRRRGRKQNRGKEESRGHRVCPRAASTANSSSLPREVRPSRRASSVASSAFPIRGPAGRAGGEEIAPADRQGSVEGSQEKLQTLSRRGPEKSRRRGNLFGREPLRARDGRADRASFASKAREEGRPAKHPREIHARQRNPAGDPRGGLLGDVAGPDEEVEEPAGLSRVPRRDPFGAGKTPPA